MEKGTQKFLAIILSIALLFCFPIVSQADENIYKETFKGTYTAPETVRNVLVSGNDATVSEWYGDRVNIGGHTYSVRQNEYGLNKDGNMIKMELNKSYTVWLAQYGVASFAFTADEDGFYDFAVSENSTYAPYFESLNNKQYNNIFYPTLRLIDGQDGKEHCYDYGRYYYHKTHEESSSEIAYSIQAGQTVYIALGDSDNQADVVYNITAAKISKENCPHDWDYIVDTDYNYDNCTKTTYYRCRNCKEEKAVTEEYHDWEHTYTHEAQNCLDSSTGTRKCYTCGKTENFTYKNDGEHVPASKTVDYIGYWDIEYECVCAVCGETYYSWEDSPCYDDESWEVHHSFGDRDNVPCGQTVTCTKCGYTYEGEHDYNTTRTKTPISENGKCYTVTYTDTCTKCGDTETDTDIHHSGAWEYVQVTPQHDNVCGTYNYACADCGALAFDEPLTCHSNIITSWDTCSHTEACRRCGNVDKYEYHDFDEGKYVAPTCTTDGGTLYTCTECGTTKLENVIPSTGHNFGNNSPTCLTCGIANPNYVAPTVPETPTTPTVPETPVTPSPTPDTTVKATALTSLTSGKKKFKAEWKKSANAQGYQLQYSTDKNFKKGTKAIIVNATSVTVSKLKENTKYYVRVRAYKTVNGEKVYTACSKAQSVITAAPPKAAEPSKTKAGKKQFKITWKKSSDAAGYQIQYSTNKNFKKGNKSVTVKGKNTTSATMKGLKAKKTYYVRVRSYRVVKVKGKATKIYSSWSKVKTVKTK